MNTTNTNWLIKLNSDADMIDMVQSSISLVITIMIFKSNLFITRAV